MPDPDPTAAPDPAQPDPAVPDGDGIVWVPVRHHSPASARAVAALIDEHDPAAVLVEGPAELTDLGVLTLGHRLPIAVMSWTRSGDGDGERAGYALYPLAEFSPEWQAVRRGLARGAQVEFIDLPWRDTLALRERTGSDRATDAAAALVDVEPDERFYAALADHTGRADLSSVWDEFFEIDPDLDAATYLRRAAPLGAGIRLSCGVDGARPDPENAAREQHMARCIARVRARTRGVVLVVTGAFHTAGLQALVRGGPIPDPLGDRREAGDEHGTALVPTSYPALDADSGYLAGQRDPGFYDRVFTDPSPRAVPDLLHQATSRLRTRRVVVTAADLIAVMTTARGLQQLRGHARMWRDDLVDGVASVLVKDVDENPPLLRALHEVLCGDRVGRLAPGTPVPHLVTWVTGRCAELGVERSRRSQDLTVDLGTTPGRDLSRLLHSLAVLEVPGVDLVQDVTDTDPARLSSRSVVRTGQVWRVRWSDRSEAALILAGRWGPTGPSAVAAVLAARTADADVPEVARVLLTAARCGIGELSARLQARLAAALQGSEDLVALATALQVVVRLHHFDHWLGTVGRSDVAGLVVLAQERCVRALERLADPGPAPAVTATVDALRVLVESTLTVSGEVDVDVEGLRRALHEQVRGRHGPEVAGALVGAAWLLTGDPEQGLSAALGDPAGTGRFYAGLLGVARHLATASPQIFDPVDLALRTWTDEEYLDALPELRRAFARANRAEKQALLAHLSGRPARAATRFAVDAPTLLRLAAQEAALWERATRLTGTPAARAQADGRR